jgi:hypothetical protein
MKNVLLSFCLISLLIPVVASADQPDFTPLAQMLTEGTLDRTELHSIMSEMLGGEGSACLPDEAVTAEANYLTYVCYYIAIRAILDFVDCLAYYYSDDCRSAIILGLLFYYFC